MTQIFFIIGWHGISQRRPVRSLQIPPGIGQSPTDFTDIHRFILGRFFCHADFADDADFFIIGCHGIYSEISCCGDYSRIFAEATCSVVADTPWDWTKRFTRDSIKNLCISVKSVGQKIIPRRKICVYLWNLWDKTFPRRKICVICEICVTKNNSSTYRARAIGQRPKFRENPMKILSHRFHRDTQIFICL